MLALSDLSRPAHGLAFDFNGDLRWTGGVIPYVFDANVTADQRVMVESAMLRWQQAANINFKKRTTESDYVKIAYTFLHDVNFSFVARCGGEQPMWVNSWQYSVVLHELGHTMGLCHEHQRSDRDDYVTISGYIPGTDINYTKLDGGFWAFGARSDNRTPYDYHSIMHYDKKGFPLPWVENVIVPRYATVADDPTHNPTGTNFDSTYPLLDIIGVTFTDQDDLSVWDLQGIQSEYGAPGRLSGAILADGTTVTSGTLPTGIKIKIAGSGASVDAAKRLQPLTVGGPGVNVSYAFEGTPTGTYVITPSKPGYYFTPRSRTVTLANGVDINFVISQFETTPPTLAVTTPTNSAAFHSAPVVSGTASDAGSGVKEVRLALYRESDGVWYDFVGNTWGTSDFSFSRNMTLATGTTSWSRQLPTLSEGGYQIHAQAVDMQDNGMDPWEYRSFVIDTTPPVASVFQPIKDRPYNASPQAKGAASDEYSGVREVRVALLNEADGRWWNWSANGWGSTTFDFATHVRLASNLPNWTCNLPSLPPGGYQVHVQSVDLADNGSSWEWTRFSIDQTPPVAWFTGLTNQQHIFSFADLRGTISEPGTVNFKITEFNFGTPDRYWDAYNWRTNNDRTVELPTTVASNLTWRTADYAPSPTRSQTRMGFYIIDLIARDIASNEFRTNIVLYRTAADTNPPSLTVDTPVPNLVITNNYLPTFFNGAAADPESGISQVNLYLYRFAGGNFLYWTGSRWTNDAVALPAFYDAAQQRWQAPVVGGPYGYAFPSGANLPNGSYSVQVTAQNGELPAGTRSLGVNFEVDYHPVYTWTAGSWSDAIPDNNNNNWDNPANWDPYGVPTDDANVFINGTPEARYLGLITANALTLNGGTLYSSNINVKFLNVNGGRLHAENRLQLADAGLFKWNGGELYGSPTRQGSFNIPTNGTVIASNSTGKALYSATFNNSGTVRWREGNIYGDESVINNGPTGLWEASAAYTLNLYPGFGAGHRGFANYGTFRKLGAIETAHQGSFTNFGTIEVQAGLFTIFDAMVWQSGSQITGAGATRLVNGCCGATALMNGSVTLDSIFDLNEPNTYLRGSGSLTLGSNGVLKVSAGYVGGNINISGPGQIAWTGGGFDGTNSLNTTVNVTGNGTKYFNRPSNGDFTFINNNGVINWIGSGAIYAWARGNYGEKPGALNNFGTFQFLADGTPFVRDGDYTAFNNYGTIVKASGTNETTFNSFRLNNWGSILAQTGTLAFVDQANFNTNSFLHGASRIRFAGAITSSNIVTASGRIDMDGGSFNSITNTNGVALTAWLGTNSFNWLGGTLYGRFVIGTNVVFNIADPSASAVTKYVGSLATIDNFGVMTWSGQGRVYGWARGNYGEYASSINNWPGATFRLLNDGGVFTRDGDYCRFTNHAGALVVKTGGTNRSTIDSFRFANSGEVRADIGTIEFSDVLHMQPGGRFTGAGAHLISAGNHTLYGTNVIEGTTVQHSGGTIVANSNSVATLRTINNGVWQWSGGAIAERMAWAGGSTMQIIGNATKQFASDAVLDNSAYVRWLGAGHVWNQGRANYGERPATWNNLSGAMFEAVEDSAFSYDGTQCNFNNFAGGTFRKTGGTNTVVYWALNNAGLVQASMGRIELAGGGLGSTGTFIADAGARVRFTGGTYTLANAALGGSGQLQVDGATVTTVGNVTFNSPASLDLISGTINGFGNYVGNPVVNWAGGWLGGTQHIAAGSVFNILGPQVKYVASGTVLNNEGVINWSGPGLLYAWARGNYGEFPSTINNLAGGTFRLLTGGSPFTRDGSYSYFNNYGSIVKAGDTNEATLNSFIVNNFGAIISQTGSLAFVDYLNLGTNSLLDGQSLIRFAGSVTASNTVTASGTIRMNGGSFNVATNAVGTGGLWLGTNTFEWLGGTLFGHHTFGSNVVVNVADLLGSSTTKYLGSLTTIDNYGQMNWQGQAGIYGWARGNYGEYASTINNRPGAVFRLLSDGVPFIRDGDYSRFTNYAGALVVKSGGTNRTTIQGFRFSNAGEVRADVGTIEFSDILHLENGGLFSGAATNLISAGNHTMSGVTTVNGLLRMSDGTITGLTNATLAASSGRFEWTGGSIGGEFTFGTGLESVLSGSDTKAFNPAAIIHNRGTIRWTGSGDIWSPGRGNYGEAPMTFNNENGAVFIAENNAAFTSWGSPHTFSNFTGATFVKSNATGTTTCNWLFNNSGTLDLQSGIMALNASPRLFAGGAINLALSGLAAGTEYARLQLAGTVDLHGALNVTLKNGFQPALSNAFDVLTYGGNTAQFDTATMPRLSAGLKWNSVYGSSALTLIVGSVHSIVGPTKLTNGHFQFTLQGPSATRAVMEASDDLQTWTPLQTNAPFTGVFLLDDARASGHTNRFYRIQITP